MNNSETLEVLDIGGIVDIFPINSICSSTGDINKSLAIAKKRKIPLPRELENLDRWLAIKFEYGDQDISKNYAINFLIEYLETRDCFNATIHNVRLGEYEILCKYLNKNNLSIKFRVGTFAPSYLCCRLFGNDPTESFCFIPHRMATNLIENGTIKLNGKFDWAPGETTIKDYQQLLLL